MANVLFRRGTQEYINNNVPISDGQVVFNETDQAIYVDTPVNNVITRLRYGGGNLSRSDIDSALSDTSENPVQNKVITESVLQKTDVVNDYNTAVAVTATDIPVGCGVIKTANTKIGNLQTSLNTTNGTVAQHTADIQALNTGLANSIIHGTVNGKTFSGLRAKNNNNIADLKITSNGLPDIAFSSDGGQTYTGGAFLPVKSHTIHAITNPPQTTLNAYSSMNWDTGIIPNRYSGYDMYETYSVNVTYAGGDTIVPTNIYVSTTNNHLIVTCFNASNRTATDIQLLVVNLTEYWRKGINY